MDGRSSRYISVFKKKPRKLSGEMKTISIFSGIIGLDLGLNASGFVPTILVDKDKYAVETVKNNFPDLNYCCKDITEISTKQLLFASGLKKGEADLLVGGPPCQPFSKSGKRKGLSDDRGGLLFKMYIKLISQIEPKAFLLENVRGLLSSNGGMDFESIWGWFKETGYSFYPKVIDAADFGVPQFRKRLFIIGFKDRIKFDFPEETHGHHTKNENLKPYVTVNDAIGKMKEPGEHRPYRGKYTHLLEEIPEGLNYSYYTKERGCSNPLFKWRTKFWTFLLKIDRFRPSLTIQANPGNNTGPFHWENRRLGIEELKRLQTIPDWFELHDSYSISHRLIGNAVPPLLAQQLGNQIKRALEENVPITEDEYNDQVLQDKLISNLNCSAF